jgi:hypothetical protein
MEKRKRRGKRTHERDTNEEHAAATNLCREGTSASIRMKEGEQRTYAIHRKHGEDGEKAVDSSDENTHGGSLWKGNDISDEGGRENGGRGKLTLLKPAAPKRVLE